MILADKAIIRYFANIASRRRNNGYISPSTKGHLLVAIRKFARYSNQEITPQFVSSLIETFKTADQPTKTQFLDQIQDFSNQQPLKSHRGYATLLKGVFRANRTRLEVFVDNHFSKKTARISEGILEQIFKALPDDTRLAFQLLQYAGERRLALCTTPFTQWRLEQDHWVIAFTSTQVKTRISHISIIPKAIGDAIIARATKNGHTCPFPDFKTIFSKATAFIEQQFNTTITAHYFRKRFATIASTTQMPPNDWDYLCGSKMSIGHEADIYQLEDNTRIIHEYTEFLEQALAINATTVKNDTAKEEIKRLNSLIESQQRTIDFLTKQLDSCQATKPNHEQDQPQPTTQQSQPQIHTIQTQQDSTTRTQNSQ